MGLVWLEREASFPCQKITKYICMDFVCRLFILVPKGDIPRPQGLRLSSREVDRDVSQGDLTAR